MVREHQSYRHKIHEFLHVNKDILRQKQDNSTTKTKLSECVYDVNALRNCMKRHAF